MLFSLFPSFGASGFIVPEKLVYTLFWGGIKAGTATLEITRNAGSIRITSNAHSADWISFFYTVDDRVESLLSMTELPGIFGLPLYYKVKTREGRHRRDNETVFHFDRSKAEFRDYIGGGKKEVNLVEFCLDPLSSFYYVRTLPLPEAGKSFFLKVFDNNKIWNTEVQVLRRERIKTQMGDFNTVVVKPHLNSDGLFSRKGDILIWLTDDAKRIPVKMQTKIKIGSVVAMLTGGNY